MAERNAAVPGGQIAAAGRPEGRSAGVRLSVGFALGAATVLLASGAALMAVGTEFGGYTYRLLPFTASCGILGGLLVAVRPNNPVGWAFALMGLLFAVGMAADQYATYGLLTRPGSLPGAVLALWVQGWVFQPALILFLFVPLYFPDGKLPSARWRWIARSTLALMVVSTALRAAEPTDIRLGNTALANPYGIDALRRLGWLPEALGLLWLALLVAAVGGLVLRFRRADREQRQQIKWLTYAVVLVTAAFVVDAVVALGAPLLYPRIFPVIQLIPVTVVVAAAIAILRHRLFDIDVLINRTLVYAALTATLLAGYLAVVGWLGTVFQARGSGAVALVATGLVAVAFAPLRDRLQRLVNRLLYGDRDEPYRVLTLLGRRLETSLAPDAVLQTVAHTVAEALKLPYAAVEVGRAGAFVNAAEHGQRPRGDEPLLRLGLSHGGEEVGRLVLAPRGRREQLSPADRRVLDDLTRRIGAAVHAVRLSVELQRSREQLVLAREEERRRVGRDLHDGLGPQLASLGMKVEAARDLIDSDPARAGDLMSELLEQTERAVKDVRRVAHQLRPPVLDALGLLAALRVHARDHQRVHVQLDLPRELPPLNAAVEMAAYHIALEALHNVASHARASRCTLRMRHQATVLHLEVTDDGCGIRAHNGAGVGLSSMRERAVELGGTCTWEAVPGGGTLVRALLPTTSAPPAATDKGALRGIDPGPNL
jgi:signal transduction histidine kinase